ncbi:hypothetical protein [Kitasatospora sp. NPDC057198]
MRTSGVRTFAHHHLDGRLPAVPGRRVRALVEGVLRGVPVADR